MWRFSPLVFLLLIVGTVRGEILSIAAASNFGAALDALNAEFKKYSPKTAVVSATASTGALVTQIRNGSPYDVLLSADVESPRALIKEGEAEANTLVTFATDRVVLWTLKPAIAVNSVVETVRNGAVKKIAIPNPDTAPCGRAAKAALTRLGAWDDAKPKLAIGESVTEAGQLVESGGAEVGFVAMSNVVAAKAKTSGHWLELPVEICPPLAHSAVLTTRGARKAAAKEYLEFLRTPMAQEVLKQYGFGAPPM